MHHQAQLIFVFLVDMGFHHAGQAGLKLLASCDPPASASQSAKMTGVSPCTLPQISVFLMPSRSLPMDSPDPRNVKVVQQDLSAGCVCAQKPPVGPGSGRRLLPQGGELRRLHKP
uniref:Uncharacterized protein n=1 Tax=Macaca mulatta TaxID=9544 RepID=A0A5F7ZT39_MACMU